MLQQKEHGEPSKEEVFEVVAKPVIEDVGGPGSLWGWLKPPETCPENPRNVGFFHSRKLLV